MKLFDLTLQYYLICHECTMYVASRYLHWGVIILVYFNDLVYNIHIWGE